MDEQLTNDFIKLISTYDTRDLMSLLIDCSGNFLENDTDEEIYEGAKNLFSKIITHYEYKSKNNHIDFYNINECNQICNIMMSYLIEKYRNDYNNLLDLVRKQIISTKQFHFELSSPKTYPKTFIDSLLIKIKPFEEFLISKYKLSLYQIQENCEKLIRFMLKSFSHNDVITHKATLITNFFPKEFLDDLLCVNEKTSEISSINSFDKFVCFPVVKIDNEHHLLSAEIFVDNFYKSIHRLCYKNASQIKRDFYSNSKGRLFNDACKTLLKEFGFSNVYTNYSYNGGEIDILIEDKDALFIIECKARNYTEKVAGISDSFIKANESNLDHASEQIHRFLDTLKSKGHMKLKKDELSIDIDIHKFNYIIPTVINIDNLAELNADFEKRNKDTIYISFDDLLIIKEVIKSRKWLLIDFFDQLLIDYKIDVMPDDIIDIFAFYCKCKNVGILFDKKMNVVIYKLGNDFFQEYFSYKNNINPINLFNNDIASFKPSDEATFNSIITEYHKRFWTTIDDLINI